MFVVLGNVYIADTYNNRVRKVTVLTPSYAPTKTPTIIPTYIPSKSPTTVPSSPPTVTPTYYPSLSPSTAFIISTIAGTGSAAYSGDNGQASSAGMNAPYGVALDASGRPHHSNPLALF